MIDSKNSKKNFQFIIPESIETYHFDQNKVHFDQKVPVDDRLASAFSNLAVSKQSYPSIYPEPSTSKHKLQDSWSFWFYKCNKSRDWQENLILITTIDTIEDFWSVYNNLKPIECLSDGCDYGLFRSGIRPMWEDPQNTDGGRIILPINKTNVLSFLNRLWLNSLLFMIGSTYDDDESENINGIVANVRARINKISVWTCKFEDKFLLDKISKRFLKSLSLMDKEMDLIFVKHGADTEKR